MGISTIASTASAQNINNSGSANINNSGNQQSSSNTPTSGTVEFIKNPIKVNSIIDFIKAIIDVLIKIAIPIIALAIIYSGFLFVSARGNTEKLEAAKRTFIYTLLGAAILLGAWALAQIISETVSAITA
jgi:hypothetical protein